MNFRIWKDIYIMIWKDGVVIQLYDNVYPLEVKAEENVRAKSMKLFIENNPTLKGIRLSMKNYEDQTWLENIPLFAFRDYLKERTNSSNEL